MKLGRRLAQLGLAALLFLAGAGVVLAKNKLSDDEVAKVLIRESIAAYPGNCPCPYNVDRAGRRCGKRSAYSRPGGAAPLCYRPDVTDEMIAEYRRAHEKD